MKPSPIQLMRSTIEKLSVEVNSDYQSGTEDAQLMENLVLQFKEDFRPLDGHWSEQNPVPMPGIEQRTFSVSLGIRTDPDDLKGPYSFEVVASGIVACVPERVHELTAAEAARQYGLAMIYGSMREQLLTVTSRMVHGGRLLPTVSFMEPPAAAKQLPLPLQGGEGQSEASVPAVH